jgi:hypothetical protein
MVELSEIECGRGWLGAWEGRDLLDWEESAGDMDGGFRSWGASAMVSC